MKKKKANEEKDCIENRRDSNDRIDPYKDHIFEKQFNDLT